ncbi:MAG: beta-ketoacyl-[acyl-carrier-protein] synthase family protein [Deltaproteobacteria bacterium]|nr:beta-ketoacyl-[acyl-carrier-protein] synthase family protein [Deltaproteobacteria bacterium]
MNRVVVTGVGIACPVGIGVGELCRALLEKRTGTVFVPEMKTAGFQCCVYGALPPLDTGGLPKRCLQTMADVAKLAAVAASEAILDAGLAPEHLETERAAVVVGTGAGGISDTTRTERLIRAGGRLSTAGGVGTVRIMSCTASANLAALWGARGRVQSVSSACCTGPDSIGFAAELLRRGVADVCLAGAAEQDLWPHIGAWFENTGEMPKQWNDRPGEACRPYDRDRQGFVLGSGTGILVLETYDHARRRGARVRAELLGYGSANDGEDLWRPNGRGLRSAVIQAMAQASAVGVSEIDYVNTHGTGTQVGDRVEVDVFSSLFGMAPWVGSTKGFMGHAMSATGAMEAVITVLALSESFVPPTANLDNVAPECRGVRHVFEPQRQPLRAAMTTNSGLGGTNACLVFGQA